MIPYRPAPAQPWNRVNPAQTLGQTVRTFMSLEDQDVQNLLVTQVVAIGYGVLSSVIYGKHKILDRVLLGLGALAFGAAAYSGFKLGLDHKPSKSPMEYVIGNIAGALNGLISLGSALAVVNPKLVNGSAADAVKEAIPF
jgi:hypothetical protein